MKTSPFLALAATVLLLAGCALTPARPSSQADDAAASEAKAARAAAVAPAIAALAATPPRVPCESLAGVALADIGGEGSRVVAAKPAVDRGVDVCVVDGTLAPAIGFKVMLPVASWTQRYLQVGCGGLCGQIGMNPAAASGCAPLDAGGFVVAATDMGHQGPGGQFGQDPRKRADFAYRAQHLTALTAKKLIAAYYGQAPAYSYFSGCSDGGREALIEAQRYPDDFDGVVAGAPAMNFQVQNSLYHAWQARSNTGPDGAPILTAARVAVLHQAVVAQCDALDGLADGLLADPRLCKPDLARVTCASGATDTAACLTPVEAEAARRLYDGPRDPVSGERLTVGGPQPGSELAWVGVFVPRNATDRIFSETIALDALKGLIYPRNPPAGFTLANLPFTRASFDRLAALHPLYDATDPDLTRFQARGGKLILWHGWSDPHISPLNTIAYHEAVRRRMGARAQGFERLYLLPGVYHCEGGEGPSAVDMLTPIMAWVEKGVAPNGVVARTPAPRPSLPAPAAPNTPLPPATAPGQAAPPVQPAPPAAVAPNAAAAAQVPPGPARPLYPFPAVAQYIGSGDRADAGSYRQGPALTTAAPPAWAGAAFYRPYAGVAN